VDEALHCAEYFLQVANFHQLLPVDWLANYNVFILTCSHFNNNSLSGAIPPELGTPSGPLVTNLVHL
jgi:hypothetical protein